MLRLYDGVLISESRYSSLLKTKGEGISRTEWEWGELLAELRVTSAPLATTILLSL